MMYLGIDYGTKRIGLALGQIMPKGAGVIDGSKDLAEIVAEIESICRENEVEGIVIGVPKKKSGDLGEIAPRIFEFGKKLNASLNVPVYYEEEELTSVEAESIFTKFGHKFEKKSGELDEMAAVLILEQYLNRTKQENK